MSYDFRTTTHGKWILAGEHAVLRKNPALVFPVPDKTLTLAYKHSKEQLNIACNGQLQKGMQDELWRTLEEGMCLLNGSLSKMTGCLTLQNNVPIGSGMGASAALCVAVARWFTYMGLLASNNELEFARQLENIFHGKSSGVDIAGASALSGVYFQSGQQKPILQTWHPQWYLSFCGEKGLTANCIEKVQTLWQQDEKKAKAIDEQMNQSVSLACEALQEKNAQALLARALNLASDCFLQWGLVSPSLKAHMQYLIDEGALAVKPTGSGGGGYVISLWKKTPPQMAFQWMRI